MTARWGLGLFVAIVLLSKAAAQESPIHGCGGAVSCQPLGFSTNSTNPNSVVLGGFRIGPNDFHFYLVTPRAKTPRPEEYPSNDLRVFHLRNVSLLPPTPTPTPRPAAPAAQVTPLPPNR
jgi:hypothetical protein